MSSSYSSRRRTSSAPSGSISCSSSSACALGQFGEEVGGVVRVHFLEDVGGAVDVEGGEDFHLVAFAHLLQDVREPFVLQLAGDLEAALVAHFLEGFGEVGGLEVLVRGHELGGGLGLGLGALQGIGPVDDEGFVAAQPAERRQGVAAADEELADEPVAGAVPVHGDVLDGRIAAAVREGHPAVEHFSHHEGFRAALFEPAQIDQAGADDLRLVDGGNPRHRHEHPLLAGNFDDDAHHVRGAPGPAGEHHDIAQSAQTVAQRVEDIQSEEARDKHPRKICAHSYRLPSLLSFS